MATLGTAYIQISPSVKGIKGSLTEAMGGEAESAGTSVGSKIGSFAKKAIVAAGIGTAIVGGVKASFEEGAKLQQSYLGGLDTLYGDAADQARAYAREAAAMGISMNDYSEQAVSFGAALKSAYGGDTKKAVEAANTALLDMADNSAKMGTPLESIQQAYQGFAKGQYQLLDNLKLGYGGTKTEMERLLADAQKITGVKYDISNLGDVYDAIHVVQGELGLTGVAAAEASETFSGSFGAMKAAAQNALGSLALGQNVQPALNDLINTTSTFFFNNLIPMLGTVIRGLPKLVSTLVKQGIPLLMSKVTTYLTNFATKLLNNSNKLTTERVKAWATTTLPKILAAAGKIVGKFVSGLITNLPKIVAAIGKIGLTVVKGLGSALWPKVKAAANGIKERFLTPIRALRERVLNVIQLLKDGFMNRIRAIRDSVGGVASSIKAKFLSPIQNLKDKIQGIVNKIKSFFSFTVGKPHIPLPHFAISPPGWKLGDLLEGVKPSLGISWYAKGGIATGPTVAGIGEAGNEAILPLNPFWKKMDEIAKGTGDITINVYGSPGMDVNELASAVERKLIQSQNRRRQAWAL